MLHRSLLLSVPPSGHLFFIFPLLYHQSILDYKYMYVDSRKWQYKTWLEEQYSYSSEYSQISGHTTKDVLW